MRRDARRLRRVPADVLILALALAPPRRSIDALRVAGGLYVRRYARGLVAVNPDGRSHVLVVSRAARRVEPIGGGALGARADTRGWRLRLVRMPRRVVLPAHSGLVLISSGRG